MTTNIQKTKLEQAIEKMEIIKKLDKLNGTETLYWHLTNKNEGKI